jgi:hypothetical protein
MSSGVSILIRRRNCCLWNTGRWKLHFHTAITAIKQTIACHDCECSFPEICPEDTDSSIPKTSGRCVGQDLNADLFRGTMDPVDRYSATPRSPSLEEEVAIIAALKDIVTKMVLGTYCVRLPFCFNTLDREIEDTNWRYFETQCCMITTALEEPTQ